jgi:hypothetical protein
MRFLERSQVLGTIRLHAQDKRLIAAVAYVGDGALGMLPVKAGDVVVVNGSREALASGATSARVLRAWFERDVHVYVHETLHAKVFVAGRTAFVGSANVSARASQDSTIEAAVQTTDPRVVADARAFVRRLAGDATAVSEAWLDWADCVPVRLDGAVLWGTDSLFEPRDPYDIWVGSEDWDDWSEDQQGLADEGRRAHRVPGGRYDILTIAEDRNGRSRLRQPDMVVLIRQRSTQLVRFLERRTRKRAAMGFYRTDRHATRVPLGDVAGALAASPAELREAWIRASAGQRAVLVELFKLPDLPARHG